MTAVIYARYSSDNQREESIEGQIRERTAYAEKNGITVIKHYIDRAFSAKTDNRPEFQQMIKDSGKKLFDVVLVWKFDRFARNRFDSANYKMILKKNGVHLISVMEPIAEGSQGILVETLLEGMAEYYSAELSEKVIRGQTENALKGKCRYQKQLPPHDLLKLIVKAAVLLFHNAAPAKHMRHFHVRQCFVNQSHFCGRQHNIRRTGVFL